LEESWVAEKIERMRRKEVFLFFRKEVKERGVSHSRI